MELPVQKAAGLEICPAAGWTEIQSWSVDVDWLMLGHRYYWLQAVSGCGLGQESEGCAVQMPKMECCGLEKSSSHL